MQKNYAEAVREQEKTFLAKIGEKKETSFREQPVLNIS